MTPGVAHLGVIRFIAALGFAMAMPFLGIYLHQVLGVSMTRIGLMLFGAGLAGAGASAVVGALSDLVGRKRLVVWFIAMRGVSFLALAEIVNRQAGFGWFATVFVVSAVLGNPVFAVTDAIVADLVPAGRRDEVYGAMRVAVNLGWTVGPAVGGLVAAQGFQYCLLITAAALLAAAVIAGVGLAETHHPGGGGGRFHPISPSQDGKLLAFLGAELALMLVQGQLVTPVSVHASSHVGLTPSQVGALYLLNGGMVVVLQMALTRRTSRFGSLEVLALSAGVYAVGYFLMGLAGSFGAMLAAMAVVTTAEMMGAPTATAYVSSLAPPGRTGAYMGTFGLVVHLGWTGGPLVGGVMMDAMPEPVWAWAAVSGLALAAGFGFLRLRGQEGARGG